MEHSHDDPFADPFAGDDDDAEASPALGPAGRHGFTPERRRLFKQALRQTGCVRDACRAAGISDSAAYKARRRDPDFAAEWEGALAIAAGDIEILAWQRAVVGVEEEVWAYGKRVGTRLRRDDRLFRMLLQSSDPNRHGGPALRSPAAVERRIREQIAEERREIEMGWREQQELRERLARKIERLRARQEEEALAAGTHFRDHEDRLIPIGYVWTGGDRAPGGGGDRPDGGGDRPDGGAGRTDPEPARTAAADPGGGENPRDCGENASPGPRIAGL